VPPFVRNGPACAGTPRLPAVAAAARPLTEDEEQRRLQLVELLETHAGNISAVARELGKDRVQIRRWIRLYGITPSAASSSTSNRR
jgi:transcriptional regulator with GAF, ATPase, and Fis domain